MNVNGIGTTGYPAWQGARKAENSAKGDFGANVKSTGNECISILTQYFPSIM